MVWHVGIPHPETRLDAFLSPDVRSRLEKEVRLTVLGSPREPGFPGRLADVDALLGSWGMPKLDADLLAAAPRLRAVCYAAGSVKGFATPEAFERGMIITTAMHANAIPVAEASMALITLANKNWFAAVEHVRKERDEGWHTARREPCAGNYRSTVGLIGFGAIGRLVAERLAGLELTVLVYDPHVEAAAIAACGAERAAGLGDLAARSDVVSLHAPDIDACAGMIDRAFLAAMRDGATLINTARGRIIDPEALVAELETGRIRAILDVTWPDEPPAPNSRLYDLPNCLLSPHICGSVGPEIRRMGAYAVEDCLRLAHGEEPRFRVTWDMLATMA